MHRSYPIIGLRPGLRVLGLLLALVIVVPSLSNAAEKPAEKKAAEQSYTGTLKTGVIAIGGETTGVTLSTDSGVYELDLGAKDGLKKKADALNGKKVVVTGDYQPRKGVEVKERRIIAVKSLRAAD